MKKTLKAKDAAPVIIFCLYIFAFFLLFLLLPGKTFSENEKRVLASPPKLTVKTLLSGEFGEEAETWCADHIPGRTALVGAAAEADRLFNLQSTKEILTGKSGRLYERAYAYSPEVIRKNMNAVNSFAEKTGKTVHVVLVPSSGYFLSDDIRGLHNTYRDDEIIQYASSFAGKNVEFLDLLPQFASCSDPESLYYRTDHHWTSEGAWCCYSFLMDALGREYPGREDYTVTTEGGFTGTLYSRSCFWSYPPEDLELWQSGGEYTVSFSDREEKYNTLFFEERLQEADKYPVYLDGNHPLVSIENLSDGADGKLLVIRDSYASCLGCFLADSYKSVTLADLRYYKLPLSDLCAENSFDDIVFLYSVGNFMTDSNIVWLD